MPSARDESARNKGCVACLLTGWRGSHRKAHLRHLLEIIPMEELPSNRRLLNLGLVLSFVEYALQLPKTRAQSKTETKCILKSCLD